MDYTIEFGAEGDVTVVTSGTAARAGFLAFVEEILDDPRFQPGTSVLIDHSALDMSPLRTEDMQALADAALGMNRRIGRTAVAIVAPASVAYGLTRQFAAFADLSSMRLRVFTARPEAVEWLEQASVGGSRQQR